LYQYYIIIVSPVLSRDIRVSGEVEFQNSPPVRINNMFAAGNGSAQQGSLSAAIPVACVVS